MSTLHSLYLLTPKRNKHTLQWLSSVDVGTELVVCEDTPMRARVLASMTDGDENTYPMRFGFVRSPWLDVRFTTCQRLTPDIGVGVIVRNYRSG